MAWHNYNIVTFEDVKKFGGKSIRDCYESSDLFNNPELTKIDCDKIQQLENRIGVAWKLKELLDFKIPKNQLKDLIGKTSCPSYTACVYAAIDEKDKDGILNIGVDRHRIWLEFRHSQPEFFSKDEIEKKYGIKIGFQLDWFTIDLSHILRKKGTHDTLPKTQLCYELDNSYFEEITEILTGYVESISKFLNDGGKFAPAGESKAEVILFRDLHHLYEESKSTETTNWLSHGARPITNPKTGNKLELDIQIEIKSVKLAIEIQGRHHYPTAKEYKNKPELWKSVEDKHRTKIDWCRENKVIFVWLDWQSFNDVVIKDRTNPRKMKSRIESVKNMIEKIISTCGEKHFYIEVFAKNKSELTFSTEENRPRKFI
jgi:hypothetical protein